MGMRIQGTFFSNAEGRTRIMWEGGEFVTTDWTSFDIADKVEVVVVPGQQQMPAGRTRGTYKCDEGKGGMYLDKFRLLQRALKAKADAEGKNVSDIEFDVTTIWAPPGGGETCELRAVACRLIGRSLGTKSGDGKAEEVQVPLSVAYLLLDGICLVNPDEE